MSFRLKSKSPLTTLSEDLLYPDTVQSRKQRDKSHFDNRNRLYCGTPEVRQITLVLVSDLGSTKEENKQGEV